jgi:aerobic carbon-monoxide dehydrogenase large subunit
MSKQSVATGISLRQDQEALRFKRIDHVEIFTDQLDRTVQFYTEVLGFRVKARDRIEQSGLGVPIDLVYLDLGGTVVELISYEGASIDPAPEKDHLGYRMIALEVDYRRVRVVLGQTDRIQYGIGAHASRASVMTGGATHAAALKIRAKALDIAGELLQVAPKELDIADAVVRHRDRPEGPSIALGDIARHLAPDSPVLGGRDPGLTAEAWFRADHMTYAYGVHIGVVRVDPETGHVAVERFLIAYDIGRAINPMMAGGQLAGGFAQGLGGALCEEFVYDARGEPLCTTLAYYALPNAGDVPPVEILLTEDAPSPLNPLGIKSVGEGGITGVGAALAAAIDDALGIPGAVTQLPATPQRIRTILRAARDRKGG